MKTVGAYEAKTHLPELLDKVASGEKVTITRRGVPVAVLVPAPSAKKRDLALVADGFRAIRESIPKAGISMKELVEEGRRH
ncbi:MAG: type II toxin-antitoxin system prevent-host-death family antitoxin [Nitrospirota bacterium]|nr:type II toxin-antitoxin system prevent-host-death family antitoxin [Nitrospirota bacterium]